MRVDTCCTHFTLYSLLYMAQIVSQLSLPSIAGEITSRHFVQLFYFFLSFFLFIYTVDTWDKPPSAAPLFKQIPSIRHSDTLDLLPIDRLPPLLYVLSFPSDAVIGEVDVLPGVQAQEGGDVRAAGRLGGEDAAAAVSGAGLGAVEEGVHGVPVARRRVPVHALPAPVGRRVRGAGEVGREDAQLLRARVPHEPDESRPEHAHGRRQELAAQRLDGAEVPFELGSELRRYPAF